MLDSHIYNCCIEYKKIISTGGIGMKKVVDACGLSCPEPVLKLKEVIDSTNEIELLADSRVCVENCRRFAQSKGFHVSVNEKSGQYTMTLTK